MIYSKIEMAEQHDWAETTKVLGISGTFFGIVIAWLKSSFKDKREARDREIERQEKERSSNIRIAVKEGMESFNQEIRQEFKDYKAQNDRQFSEMNKRIDDVFKELKK